MQGRAQCMMKESLQLVPLYMEKLIALAEIPLKFQQKEQKTSFMWNITPNVDFSIFFFLQCTWSFREELRSCLKQNQGISECREKNMLLCVSHEIALSIVC